MAIANFFDKIALSAAQLLKGYNRSEFEQVLLNEHIHIHFDNTATNTFEGKEMLKLLVNMLARLYPNLSISNAGGDDLVDELQKIAKSISPAIDLNSIIEPTVALIVGSTLYQDARVVFYIGSDNWNVHFSRSQVVGCGTSGNPIGAGAAACFGAANVFRTVFRTQLPHSDPDEDFTFSMLDFSFNPINNGLQLTPTKLNDLILVGGGAVGNGFIWALSKLNELSGTLTIIDKDPVDLSNLQRYILTDQDSVGHSKPLLAAGYLKHTRLDVIPETKSWAEWIGSCTNRDRDTIVVAVDNVKDRILIQGSLPRQIFNAWTQQENLGVSRHRNFVEDPCLCCVYFPTDGKKSISQEIADALNVSTSELIIRKYLANRMPVDEPLIRLISENNNISYEELSPFSGKQIQSFYSQVVCGGVLMRLNPEAEGHNASMQVPTTFESVFAGILLASEIMLAENNFTIRRQTRSEFNLIRPLSRYINSNVVKIERCICNDVVYQNIYAAKYLNLPLLADQPA